MKNGEIEKNESEQTEEHIPVWSPNMVPLSHKAGTNVKTSQVISLDITMSEIQRMGLIDKRPRYANGKMNFEIACIGEKATYSLDSAHRGGQFMKSKDGVVFRVGAKGIDALRSRIVTMPDGL